MLWWPRSTAMTEDMGELWFCFWGHFWGRLWGQFCKSLVWLGMRWTCDRFIKALGDSAFENLLLMVCDLTWRGYRRPCQIDDGHFWVDVYWLNHPDLAIGSCFSCLFHLKSQELDQSPDLPHVDAVHRAWKSVWSASKCSCNPLHSWAIQSLKLPRDREDFWAVSRDCCRLDQIVEL